MAEGKILMMDAGTALFEMEGGFGTALGQVRAELKEFGKVSDDEEDMILELPGIWRKRIIACTLEGAGDSGDRHRYAAVFREGSCNTRLRNIVHGTLAAAGICIPVIVRILFPELANPILSGICTAGALAAVCSWIRPDRKSAATTKALIGKISGLK